MKITFQINYRAQYGQEICIVEQGTHLTHWTEKAPLVLTCYGQDFWSIEVEIPQKGIMCYNYYLRDREFLHREDGNVRRLAFSEANKALIVRDFWQIDDYEKSFYTTAFAESLFRRNSPHKTAAGKPTSKGTSIRFSIDMPQVLPTQGVGIMGNIPELGNWQEKQMLRLDDSDFPIWHGEIAVKAHSIFEYKYVLYNLATGEVEDIEYGENRHIWGIDKIAIQQNDRHFRRTKPSFKGAGVAIPIFSLRTDEDFGIGEFLDLKKMADWAAQTGLKMIQTLPINDTTLTHTNLDSYPYSPVSVFALHPIYINIEKMGKLTSAQKKSYNATKKAFNQKNIADYQCVYDEKMKYFRALYQSEGEQTFKTADYQAFYRKNHDWLDSYADYMSSRDNEPKAFYCYLQYHADKQLAEAVRYAHSVGVAMKGDIPIGINPNSVDAYSHPQLFNLQASAGAPPDDFDARGQNWGFPTYNWDEMQKDGYDWWQRRFKKMQDYFDAYRIDHILGLFRIWQMRKTDVWGLCGHFCPALPYSLQDLWNMGVKLDEDRMTKPYIRSNFLSDVFGEDTELVKNKYLKTNDGYVYYFPEWLDNQVKVQTYFDEGDGKILVDKQRTNIRDGLMYLHMEVLFVRDQQNEGLLHPRISIYQSHSFNELYEDQRNVLLGIYNDYFFSRHTQFWRDSAMRKLPTLIGATRMLCCGEDLGMVPNCVPDVMHELQILSLEIQRMPKDPNMAFAHPGIAPYLSVCTTGTHDMNPLRAWWKEDKDKTQFFYNNQMGWQGEAPSDMSPEIAEFIINQHMYSPAMWTILPLQDWLAIDGELRLPDVQGERINLPSNPKNFWCYRMHIRIEDLLQNDAFNQKILRLTSVR